MNTYQEVPGFKDYLVRVDGLVFSAKRWRYLREMKGQISHKGYRTICLTLPDGTKKRRPVHQLVLEAYHGKRPKGFQSRHLNGDKLDNRASNLRWGTCKENHADQVIHGVARRGEQHGRAKITAANVQWMFDNRDRWTKQQMAERLGVDVKTIRSHMRGATFLGAQAIRALDKHD